mmetsp:Transcript_6290/g.14227  ORF Transcript_6290/g.14227 Transcript_6290/m.14227 type:complete len:95 (-) Transcript_6290:1234-1518(-)
MYSVAFSEAMLCWNKDKLAELEAHMRKGGMDQSDIDKARYFNPSLFLACVDRRALPPSLLYWRVRAVFVTYGNMKDKKGNLCSMPRPGLGPTTS